MNKYLILLLIATLLTTFLHAQEDETKPPNSVLFHVGYGFQVPGGDLNNDFGVTQDLGFGLSYLYQNFLFGVEGNFLFGNKVKIDPLSKLRVENGGIVSVNNELGQVLLTQRAYYVGGNIGIIQPIFKKSKRSGIRFTIGSGLFQHKIKIIDISEGIRQLDDPYIKGYDRLTNGLAFKEFLGYHYFSKNRLLNFFVGVESVQAFTKNRRSINFDTMTKDDTPRFDMLFGLRIGWNLPLYVSENKDDDKFYY